MARARFLDRFSRRLKIAIQVGILLVIVGSIGTVGFIEYSSRPSFCLNCHIMEPYYESWATSSHNQVPCIQCHYAPGIKAEAMGKLQAANQVVKYVTGTYGTKPWAEIEDAACLRCHSERKLEGIVSYGGIGFDHAKHLGELRHGKQLRCTSCHSQIVQGDHFTVREGTCFLCHFRDQPPGAPIAGCTGCHAAPPHVVSPAGFVVDHPRYVRDLVSCVSCHDRVTEGSGAADQARCFNCHNEPERIERFSDTTLIHWTHIAVRNIECTQCHTPIQHRVVSLTATFELDCRGCHQGVHDAQRRLYAGMGGHGTADLPSSMFLARVSCQSCHGLPTEVKGHEQVQRAGEATCLSCHGVRYANILPSWQEEMERRRRQAEPVVERARALLGSAPVRTRAAVDSLLGLATENLRFVELGKGAHNIVFADELIRASIGLVREAVRVGPLPYRLPEVDLGPPIRENICLRCHLGVEREAIRFGPGQFDHGAHVVRGGLECEKCHTPLEEHGGTTLKSIAGCDACHHRAIGGRNCAACHEGPGGAPIETMWLSEGDFSHPVHRAAGLGCADCHRPPTMSAAGLRCEGCHADHHRPETTCLGCHRGGALAEHTRDDHVLCSGCHRPPADRIDRWSRSVCMSCHADLTDHYAPRACEECHRVPPLGSARAGRLTVPTRPTRALERPGDL